MRLFVALDIEPAIRDSIARFSEGVKGFAPAAKWVDARGFHITLKFIGEKSPAETEAIKQALAALHGHPTKVRFRGFGVFPNPRSARVYWVGIEADTHLATLAAAVDEALGRLGIPREEHAFSPHLTLARGGDPRHPRGGSGSPHPRPGDRGNSAFAHLLEKLGQLPSPEFGVMEAGEFFLYESKLLPGGAQYTKLARFPLSDH